jgi:hypothetical protein
MGNKRNYGEGICTSFYDLVVPFMLIPTSLLCSCVGDIKKNNTQSEWTTIQMCNSQGTAPGHERKTDVLRSSYDRATGRRVSQPSKQKRPLVQFLEAGLFTISILLFVDEWPEWHTQP